MSVLLCWLLPDSASCGHYHPACTCTCCGGKYHPHSTTCKSVADWTQDVKCKEQESTSIEVGIVSERIFLAYEDVAVNLEKDVLYFYECN